MSKCLQSLFKCIPRKPHIYTEEGTEKETLQLWKIIKIVDLEKNGVKEGRMGEEKEKKERKTDRGREGRKEIANVMSVLTILCLSLFFCMGAGS